jgi:hypothetical protein
MAWDHWTDNHFLSLELLQRLSQTQAQGPFLSATQQLVVAQKLLQPIVATLVE